MPSRSKKQARFMAAVAHNPEFARRVGVPQSVGKEFHSEDRKMKKGYAKGGRIQQLKRDLKSLTDQELDAELSAIDDGTGPKDLDYIDRRGRVQDANPGPDSPRRRYQDILDERIRRRQGKAKGGAIKSAVGGMDLNSLLQRQDAIHKQLEQLKPGTPEHDALLDELNAIHARVQKTTVRPAAAIGRSKLFGGGFAKGGPLDALSRLKRRRTTAAASPAGPLFRDSYGNEYNSPEELLAGIRQAVEEESDEPRWEDAAAMLQKLPGSEKAQAALTQLQGSFDNPAANIESMLQMWSQALAELENVKPGMAKGGAVKRYVKGNLDTDFQYRRGLEEVAKKLGIENVSGKSSRELAKAIQDAERARDTKLSTFAKGGSVRKKKLSKLKRTRY